MSALDLFAFGGFIGCAVFTAIIIAVALVGPLIGQGGTRGAVGIAGLAIYASLVGGALTLLFMPVLP